jgi:hypothetical protein
MTSKTQHTRATRHSTAVVREPVVVLGRELHSHRLYALRHEAFRRGIHVLGAIGTGKTSLIRRYLLATGVSYPWVLHDFIGTGHRHIETWIATLATILAVAERRCPLLAGITGRFLARFAFTSIGDPNPAIRFDLLRRRTLPDGRRETVRDVTGRALEVFFAKLNDPDAAQRVRFRRIATALLACLVAAERPITEALLAFDDPVYIAFLERELALRRFRRSDHRFLSHQLSELHHVLALRPSDPTKSWRAFEDMTESTRNSMSDFAPGTLLGEIFGAETFPLEAVAFGRTSPSVTTRHADDTLKSQAFQALHAMLHALFLHRQDLAAPSPLTYLLDEPRWVRRNFPGILAVSRNLGVSYVIAHQSLSQFQDIELPTLASQLRALTNLQIAFRPTCFDDAEDEMLHTRPLRPDGLVQRFTVSGSSESDADSSSVRHAWDAVFGQGDTTYGSATSSGVSEQDVLNVVGFQDQLRYAAQAALWRPRYTGTVTLDGRGTEIAFASAPEFASVLAGIPILAHTRAWYERYWWSRLVSCTPYEPFGMILLSRAGASSDPEEPLTGVASTEAPSTMDVHANDALATHSTSDEPRSAVAPLAPPTFPVPPRGSRSSRQRRRRHRGAGGARDAS